jgi:hypothetical protein
MKSFFLYILALRRPWHIRVIANLSQKRLKVLGEVVSDGEDDNEDDADDVSNNDVD